MSLRARWEIVQNKNIIQVADNSALIVFTIRATWVASLAKCEKRLAVRAKNGAPGGCPISSLSPIVMNSGQSQKLAVDSIVEQ